MTTLDQIRERLDKATEFSPVPWRPIVNTAQVRFGVVDATGCIVDTTGQRKADFLAHTPTDTALLLSAVDAVLALHGPEETPWGVSYCEVCADWEDSQLGEGPPRIQYPCPTRTAITQALETK